MGGGGGGLLFEEEFGGVVMKKFKKLTDEEIIDLDGRLATIKLNIQDPKFVGGFSVVLDNGDQIYIDGDLDDSSYIEYMRIIE